MAKVVVAEDAGIDRDVLVDHLEEAGHTVRVTRSGQEVIELARAAWPEVALLAWVLEDMQATQVCRTLRAANATWPRVIFLGTSNEEIDRIVAFELGADDYVAKPFSVRELVLRVRAVSRKDTPAAGQVLSFRTIVVDLASHKAFLEGAELELTALEFKLLRTLVERRGRVQTRTTLFSDVWGADADPESRTLDTHVKRLREKLGASGGYIETIRGVGYRLTDDPGL
jgi:two-component system phosphate regulon response regulator PhoB